MRKLIFIFSILLLFSCKKEKNVTYQLNDVTIENNTANKDHLKSTTEFISIAYSDIFGTVISTNKLADLTTIYKAASYAKKHDNQARSLGLKSTLKISQKLKNFSRLIILTFLQHQTSGLNIHYVIIK